MRSSTICFVIQPNYDAFRMPLRTSALEGRECFAGMDLASTQNLSALVLAFPPEEEGENAFWRSLWRSDPMPLEVSTPGQTKSTEPVTFSRAW
jgi:hypothetical protein